MYGEERLSALLQAADLVLAAVPAHADPDAVMQRVRALS